MTGTIQDDGFSAGDWFWTAQASTDVVVVHLSRARWAYDQRDHDEYLEAQRMATETFPPGPDIEDRIQAWADRTRLEWETRNAAGLVATRLAGRHRVDPPEVPRG